jgi:tagatose 1,6-diphosphate aldolase GatY/KbaY
VFVQLDHANDEALIRTAIDAGVDAVLAGGSICHPSRTRSAAAQAADDYGKTDPDQLQSFLVASRTQLPACGVTCTVTTAACLRSTGRGWRDHANADTLPLVLPGASSLHVGPSSLWERRRGRGQCQNRTAHRHT